MVRSSVIVLTAILMSGCVVTPSQKGAVLGGVTGGVIGNQIGSGSGKTVATAVGAVVGAMAGSELANRTYNNGGVPQCYSSPYGTVIVRSPCPYTGPSRYRYGLPPSRFQECEVYPTISERRACTQGVNRRELEIQRGLDREAYNGGLSGYHGN